MSNISKDKKAQKAQVEFPSFSAEEISKHNTVTDAWICHNGYVYDITKFIAEEKHPGGVDSFMEYLGRDVQEPMDATDHSPFAFTLIKEFLIGTVKGEKQIETFPATAKHMRGYDVSEIRDLIDFDKPLLSQVIHTGDKYWPWMMNRPVCTTFEIFDWKFLENNCSRWPWWYIWVVFPPIILYCLYQGATLPADEGGAGGLTNLAVSFAFGIFMWTLTEYFLHRFIFHMESYGNVGNTIHFFAHGVHHLLPSDHTRLTFPPPLSLVLAYLFKQMWFFVTPTALFSPWALFSAFALGYVLYDTAHFFFHHTDFDNRLFRFCKSSHLGHHYKNEDMNFGVTSPMWDIVFGTYDPYNRTYDLTKNK